LRDWSLAHVSLIGLGYIAGCVLLAAAMLYARLPSRAGLPDVGFAISVPSRWILIFLAALLVPPGALLVAWLVARFRAR
jgi:hypothetical protein